MTNDQATLLLALVAAQNSRWSAVLIGRKHAETISYHLVILAHYRPHKLLQGFRLRTVWMNHCFVTRYSLAAFEQSLAEGLLAKDLVQRLATCEVMRNVLQQLQQKD